jgi:2-dehydro-3-deoxyphosphogluconate aldolase / (4S)-4-hydroxy-2-oxoglutarate aldolase
MGKISTIETLLEAGVLGIIRVDDDESLLQISEALRSGGVHCLEITLTTPGALRAIEAVVGRWEDVVMGAGTVLDGSTARQAILAGAQFLVTPTVELDVIEVAHRYGVPVIAGAMTPTEILGAWEAGSDLVKVFPAGFLGPEYLKAIHGPLPQIPLVPTGGVTSETAGSFVRAGAAIVSAGSWLVDADGARAKAFDDVTERARLLVGEVTAARGEIRT